MSRQLKIISSVIVLVLAIVILGIPYVTGLYLQKNVVDLIGKKINGYRSLKVVHWKRGLFTSKANLQVNFNNLPSSDAALIHLLELNLGFSNIVIHHGLFVPYFDNNHHKHWTIALGSMIFHNPNNENTNSIIIRPNSIETYTSISASSFTRPSYVKHYKSAHKSSTIKYPSYTLSIKKWKAHSIKKYYNPNKLIQSNNGFGTIQALHFALPNGSINISNLTETVKATQNKQNIRLQVEKITFDKQKKPIFTLNHASIKPIRKH